jgi:hypothetical protein
MKQYWEIPGPSKAPHAPCIAFDKLDGSNLRFEWSKKRGWYKFGTRKRLFDKSDEEYGCAIQIFQDTYADDIVEVFKKNKAYRGVQQAIVFCEFYGPNSFAGQHVETDPKELMLFDVSIHKKGIVLPREFINHFGHLKTPTVIYEGNFNKQLFQDVRDGKYSVTEEGVVCKGVLLGKKKNPQHGLWMSKIKTKKWFERLQQRAEKIESLKKVLADNLKEQCAA